MAEKESLKALTVLLRAAQTIQDVLRKDIQKFDINLTEFAVLELLYHKGDQPIQRIGEKILITSGSITYVVDKLEKKGFTERIACPTDRRVTFASLTAEGKNFIEKVFPEHEKKVEELFEPIDAAQTEQLITALKAIGLQAKSN